MNEDSAGWHVVVPVKELVVAKSRFPEEHYRAELARALALDTLTAVTACPRVTTLWVVTTDEAVRDLAAPLGAQVLMEAVADGINPAVAAGTAAARRQAPDCAVAALPADLPALRPADLEIVLVLAEQVELGYVPDLEGEGTTVLTCGPGRELTPAFGLGSARSHRALGASEIAAPGGVRRDVDTMEHLVAAARLGLGPHCSAFLAALSGPPG